MPPQRDVPGPRPVVDKQRAAGIMLTGTGCLGLSLRATTISAGIITLVESVLWAALSIASYAAYSCTYEVPKDLNINLRLAYILYYLDPGCQLLSDLTPADSQESLQVLYSGVLTAERTKAFSVAYICISFVWLGTSALLLATLVGRIPGRAGARLCIPWIILTAGTMLLDLIAMGFYSSDIAAFKSIEDVAIWTNVQIPREWLKDADSSLKIPPLILLLISLRGVVLWLLNGVLLVHVGRAVRMMMADERDQSPEVEITKRIPNPSDERQAKFAGAGHSSDPLQPLELLDKPLALQDLRLQRGVLEHQEAVGAIRLPEPLEAPEDLLETRLRPAVLEPSEPLEPLGSLEPEEQWPWNGVPEPLEPLEPRSHPGPLERLDSPEPSEPTEQQEPFGPRPGVLGPSAVAVLPALPLDAPRPGVALPLDAPRPGLVRAASAASDLARPSRGRLQSPQLSSPRLTAAKILDRLSSQRMSDREIRGRSESPRHRFERLSHLRTSGREGAVSPAIEAKINKIMRSSTSVTPPGSPSDRYSERTAWEYHDHEEFHEHDVFDSRDQFREPRHHHGPDYPRKVLEFEDVPQASSHRRHLPRLDRTQSDRPFGEWKMGQRPPGNLHSLHSLSPLHGARHARHAEPSYNPGQEATKELKKELPWSYLHNTSDQDPAFLDRDLRGPHGSPSKAVHNVYLPSEREDERSSRSPSSRAKPNEKLSSDVLMY